jgi:hypothetical protein
MRWTDTNSNLVMSGYGGEDEYMGVTRIEKFVVSGIYLVMAVSAGRLLMTGLSSPDSVHFQDSKLLLAAALAGAVTLLLSGILIHFRPAKAYVTAMVALQFLMVAFFPLLAPIILELLFHRTLSFSNYSVIDLFSAILVVLIAVFTPVRLFKLVSSTAI